MPKDTVTSIDVAKRAGVSQSAVSRVFTPGASVSARTAEKVRAAAAALGYRPNVLARSLTTGSSRMIGVVFAYLDNQYYPLALEALTGALQAQGYHALIFMASPPVGDYSDILQEILDYRVDGIVIASTGMSNSLAARCLAEGIPVVLFNRSQDDDRLSAVTSDNTAGGRKVAEFLVAGGHRRIAYLAGWEGASTQRDRENGFVTALRAAGATLHSRDVGQFDAAAAKQATRRLFSGAERPDALFAANDHMAFAAMDVLRFELGLTVPADVSVVGYDDVPLASWPVYDLTTVRQPINRMVAETVDTLMAHLSGAEKRPRRVAIDGPLMIRGSARIPDGWQDDARL